MVKNSSLWRHAIKFYQDANYHICIGMPLLINGKLVWVLQYSGIWHVAINTFIKQTVHGSGMQHLDIKTWAWATWKGTALASTSLAWAIVDVPAMSVHKTRLYFSSTKNYICILFKWKLLVLKSYLSQNHFNQINMRCLIENLKTNQRTLP
jgi:hypothetical protein